MASSVEVEWYLAVFRPPLDCGVAFVEIVSTFSLALRGVVWVATGAMAEEINEEMCI